MNYIIIIITIVHSYLIKILYFCLRTFVEIQKFIKYTQNEGHKRIKIRRGKKQK